MISMSAFSVTNGQEVHPHCAIAVCVIINWKQHAAGVWEYWLRELTRGLRAPLRANKTNTDVFGNAVQTNKCKWFMEAAMEYRRDQLVNSNYTDIGHYHWCQRTIRLYSGEEKGECYVCC